MGSPSDGLIWYLLLYLLYDEMPKMSERVQPKEKGGAIS